MFTSYEGNASHHPPRKRKKKEKKEKKGFQCRRPNYSICIPVYPYKVKSRRPVVIMGQTAKLPSPLIHFIHSGIYSFRCFPILLHSLTSSQPHSLSISLQLRDECIPLFNNIIILPILAIRSCRLNNSVDFVNSAIKCLIRYKTT